jgi:hypothetical protein
MARVPTLRRVRLFLACCCFSLLCHAQSLAPRAYVIVPVRSNAITITDNWQTGSVLLPGGLPIEDSTGRINTPILSYYTGFGLLGRSANFTVSLPYAVGTFSGNVKDQGVSVYRSGLEDASMRFSVNLKGGPAMDVTEFRSWRQKTLIGASMVVVTPTGQYDAARLINYSARHWAFRPEIGLSQRWRRWLVDVYGAVWLFTPNRQEYPTHFVQTQKPIAAVESHLSYDVKARLWFSFDANFWRGGTTSLNGVERPLTLQENSRIGATASIPVSRRQSLKFSYSGGAYYTFGGNFQSLSLAWQYSWITKPK